ncbi:hypothetical protein [Nocardioides insulae]|uniref:hypothetical protein n=1 Tax=Nocardioides insulae TaxID=394734 RepID=UPI00041B75E0|nr:hypothetical protein [Nocardioides insulae]
MNDIDAIATLRESLDVDQQRFEEALRRTGPIRATDPTATVVVRLAADGRVDRIELGPDWVRHHTGAELGGVVVATHAMAAGERMRAYLTAFAESDGVRRPRPAPIGGAPPTAPVAGVADLAAIDPGPVMAGMGALLEELDACLTEALALAQRQQTAAVLGRGPAGIATARLTATGALAALELAESRLAGVPARMLGGEITAAVHEAQEQVGDPAAEITEASGLGRLRRLVHDPTALIGTLAEGGAR